MKILPVVEDKSTLLAFARMKGHDDWPTIRRHLEKVTYATTMRKFMDAQDPVAVAHRSQITLLLIEELMELFDTAYERWQAWDQKEKAETVNKGIPPG
jgi:hypothetical protein